MAVEVATVISQGTAGIIAGEKESKFLRYIVVETANTVDAGDTFSVDIANYDGTVLVGMEGFVHTTDNSVITTEADTVAVVGTVATITVAVGTDNDKRVAKLYYY